jgi:signal transduction histidine kinase/ligand-binding sensor domain-containing protein/DNA-binding NarL/FixJ family response regulator
MLRFLCCDLLKSLLLVAFVAHVPKLYGQGVGFDSISLTEGLSQATLTTIYQDNQGFMWFGTRDGLNRFDGYEFKVFQHDPEDPFSISLNDISSIVQDREGYLWVGTYGGGINRLDLNTMKFKHYRNDRMNPNSLTFDGVTKVFIDSKGELWAGTYDYGLNRLNRNTGEFVHYLHDPNDPHSLSHNRVWDIMEDSKGRLWITTLGGGISILNDQRTRFEHIKKDPNDPLSLPTNQVWSAYEDEWGAVWIGTSGQGLLRLDPLRNRFVRYVNDPDNPNSLSNNDVRTLIGDPDGNLWVGTWGGGLNQITPDRRKFRAFRHELSDPISISSDYIDVNFIDSAGVLWVGTRGGGISKLDRYARKFSLYRHDPVDDTSLGDNSVWCFYEDSKQRIWVGTNSGLDLLDRETGTFTHYNVQDGRADGLNANGINAILEDSKGRMWVASWGGGISQFDPDTGTFESLAEEGEGRSPSEKRIRKLVEHRGYIWVGTFGGGLNRFDPETGDFKTLDKRAGDISSLSHDEVWSILPQGSRLWIGTSQGLNIFHTDLESFQRFYKGDKPGDLSDDYVMSLALDDEGYLWLGTRGGLNRMDLQRQTFTSWRVKDGLPNDQVMGVLIDDKGFLWLSTNRGLSRFDPREERFRNYDIRDGLQSNEFQRGAAYRSSQGELFFGGINGFNSFFSDGVLDNPNVPNVVLTQFQLFNQDVIASEDGPLNKDISQAEQITLTAKQSVFSFGFAALNYQMPEKNLYQYKLVGFDQDWNQTTAAKRFATYTNLPAGNYTFRVKASNNDEVWNVNGTHVQIQILPTFWQSPQAYLVYGIIGVFLLVLAFGVWRRWRYEERLRREKESADLANRSKSEFLSNMSHELRTPLNAILGFTQLMRRDQHISSENLEYLKLINRSGEHLLRIINDVLEMSKIEEGRLTLSPINFDVHIMLDELKKLFSVRATEKHLKMSFFTDPGVPQFVRGDQDKLRQVLVNLLGNAIKFTSEGEVDLSVRRLKADEEGKGRLHLLFEVRDTGPGIPEDEQKLLFSPFVQTETGKKSRKGTGLGLAISKKFVQLMDGRISVKSTPGTGSIFKFDVFVEEPKGEPETYSMERPRRVISLAPDQPICKILIVEDNPRNRDLLIRFLEPLGFEVETAFDGKDGLDRWLKNRHQLIIMDKRMPVMDGLTATRIIRSMDDVKQPRILALTASAFEEDRRDFVSAGADDFISKPYREEILLEKIGILTGIEYVYKDEDLYYETGLETFSELQPSDALAQFLSELPESIRKQLREATTLGDVESLQALLNQLDAVDEVLTSQLRSEVENFAFDQIQEMLDKATHLASIRATQN